MESRSYAPESRRYAASLIVLSLPALLFAACGGRSGTDGNSGAALTSIAIQPAALYAMAGTTRQIMAVGTYSDNSTADVTDAVTWKSSDNATATVSNGLGTGGVVTAVAHGSALLTASLGGITSTAPAHVLSITLASTTNPHVRKAILHADAIGQIDNVDFTIQTKPGNNSKDVHVSYSMSYLSAHSYVDNGASKVTIPVFGLYAGYANQVSVGIHLKTGESLDSLLQIQTAALSDDKSLTGIVVSHPYPTPGTSYILIDTRVTPTIVDIDGETRWRYNGYLNPIGPQYIEGPIHIDKDSLMIGVDTTIFRINFLGEPVEEHRIQDTHYEGLNHNFDVGKSGLFGTMQYNMDNNAYRPESVLLEFSNQAKILGTWDFDEIIGGAIRSAGEDPSGFVQDNVDWFHMNSSTYSAKDDGIIVSSRENFVVKVDYSTKKIRWLLGNTGKAWYQNYPLGLQPLALAVTGKAPIGQHSVSLIGSDNQSNQLLLLFNNGKGNLNLPNIGDDRTYSAVSLYEIDESARTATEIWTFEDNQTILSEYCGSVYKTTAGEFLVNYAMADSYTKAILMVVDTTGTVKFQMIIPKRTIDLYSCYTAYRAREIKLEEMHLQ